MINEQIIEENYKTAFNIIQYFFSFLDFILFFVFICLTNYNLNSILQLFCLLIIDILTRFLEIINYSVKKTFNKSLFITFFESLQFIIIISYINKGFINSNNYYVKRNAFKNSEYIFYTIFFSLLTFPIEVFYFKDSYIFYIFKCLLTFLYLFYLKKYIIKKYNEYLENNKYKVERNMFIFSILLTTPDLIFYLYYFKYVLKVLKVVLKNKLYISYIQMGIICINESAKYTIILFLGGLLYIYESDVLFNRGNGKYTVRVSQSID